jgi:hypothetical protein
LVIKILDLKLDLDPDPDSHPDPQLEKMLDPDPYPDPHLIDADPQPCIVTLFSLKIPGRFGYVGFSTVLHFAHLMPDCEGLAVGTSLLG